MFLDKDLPIIGMPRNDLAADLLRKMADNMLLQFSRQLSFPGVSPVLDSKGKPYRKEGAGETIKFKRYQNLKVKQE